MRPSEPSCQHFFEEVLKEHTGVFSHEITDICQTENILNMI